MSTKYWLMKCEPSAYAIEDLERDGKTSWEGVRNYQARNFMRDQMEAGDKVLFYASNADPPGVTGIAEIVKEAYPDQFAFQKKHDYFDPKSDPKNPTWYMVDIGFVERFADTVSLSELKDEPKLAGMMVTQKGSRLSVQPVERDHYQAVVRMGRAKKAKKK